jgi:hypothetical protein
LLSLLLRNYLMHHRRPQKRRAILTEQQAIEIFRIGSDNSTPSATVVARRYGINERTVRDIWNQRTWTHATWPIAQSRGSMAGKKMGRPIGSKDSSPRKQKLVAGTSISTEPAINSSAGTSISTEPAINSSSLACNQQTPCFELRRKSGLSHDIECEDQLGSVAAVARRRLFCSLLPRNSGSEPSLGDEAALLGSPFALPSNENLTQEGQQESIDDQLHAWADGCPHWINIAALPQQHHHHWQAAIS